MGSLALGREHAVVKVHRSMHRHLELADAAQAQHDSTHHSAAGEENTRTMIKAFRSVCELVCRSDSRCRPVRAPLAQGQHDRLLGAHRLACVLVGAVAAPDDIVAIEQVHINDLEDG